MPAMTPWAYTDDMSVQFNVARAMLGDNDAETARLTDQNITTTLATFGWQAGMAVLAQQMIVAISQEVIRSQEAGGSSYQWADDRLDALKALKTKADAGTLPDPATGAVIQPVPGSMVLANAPEW